MTTHQSPLSVVVIHDHDSIREKNTKTLEAAGLTVSSFRNGYEFVTHVLGDDARRRLSSNMRRINLTEDEKTRLPDAVVTNIGDGILGTDLASLFGNNGTGFVVATSAPIHLIPQFFTGNDRDVLLERKASPENLPALVSHVSDAAKAVAATLERYTNGDMGQGRAIG